MRVQRVQEISEENAIAEGVEWLHGGYHDDDDVFRNYRGGPDFGGSDAARRSFRSLWDSLNAGRGFGWDANPCVVAITFKTHRRNINRMEE